MERDPSSDMDITDCVSDEHSMITSTAYERLYDDHRYFPVVKKTKVSVHTAVRK